MSSPNRSPGGALHALIGQTSTGPGASHQLGGAFSTFVIQGYVTTGSGSTVAKCALEGCLSTVGWQVIGGATFILSTTTKTKLLKSTNAVPVANVRVRVKAWSTRAGSTAPDNGIVNAWIAAQY